MTFKELRDKILEVGGSEDDPIHFMASVEICAEGNHNFYEATKIKVERVPHAIYKDRIYDDLDELKLHIGDDLAEDMPGLSDAEMEKEIEEYIFKHAIDVNPVIVVYLDV
jgi:hypothetical protein